MRAPDWPSQRARALGVRGPRLSRSSRTAAPVALTPERVRGGLAVGDRRGDHLAQPRGQPVRALRRLSLLR